MKKDKNISGFKTPENYFENFEMQLFSKIEEINLPRSAGFHVPENYFEGLDQRILNSITSSEKPKKVISLFPKKYFGYAAAIAACFIVGLMVFNSQVDKGSLDALQLASIDYYIDEGNLNLDLYDIATFINDDDITNVNLEQQQFSQATLKNYLLENLDEETLIDEQ